MRFIGTKPKVTTVDLVAECAPHVLKTTIYWYLKKSGIQKWRCRKRPLLTEERAAARLQWAHLHDGQDLEY